MNNSYNKTKGLGVPDICAATKVSEANPGGVPPSLERSWQVARPPALQGMWGRFIPPNLWRFWGWFFGFTTLLWLLCVPSMSRSWKRYPSICLPIFGSLFFFEHLVSILTGSWLKVPHSRNPWILNFKSGGIHQILSGPRALNQCCPGVRALFRFSLHLGRTLRGLFLYPGPYTCYTSPHRLLPAPFGCANLAKIWRYQKTPAWRLSLRFQCLGSSTWRRPRSKVTTSRPKSCIQQRWLAQHQMAGDFHHSSWRSTIMGRQ